MTARQLAEWRAYDVLEPFGARADFWQAGLITSMIANVNRGKKSDKVMKPEDFMPKGLLPEPAEADADEANAMILSRFQGLADLHKARGGFGPHG